VLAPVEAAEDPLLPAPLVPVVPVVPLVPPVGVPEAPVAPAFVFVLAPVVPSDDEDPHARKKDVVTRRARHAQIKRYFIAFLEVAPHDARLGVRRAASVPYQWLARMQWLLRTQCVLAKGRSRAPRLLNFTMARRAMAALHGLA
jgi:hypothetical protein